jgi:hypothetical protein
MAHFAPTRALRRPAVITVLVLVALLIALRVSLPFLLTHYLNRAITQAPDYEGSIADVDIHLWRGAYSIHKIEVRQIKGDKVTPLFNAQTVDLSVDWRQLLHGSLVGEMTLTKPQINIVAEPKPEDVKEEKFRLQDLVDRFTAFMPLNINRFEILDGEAHFGDQSAAPPIDLYFDQVHLVAHNLTNSERVANNLWATVSGTGRMMGSGQVKLEMRLNPSAKQPTFDLAFELKDLRLTALNDYLRRYLAVEARDGWVSLYAEAVARDGRFKGYVKPVVKDLDILEVKQENKGVGEAVKGLFVKILAYVFKNKPQEQLATRIDFAGSFDNPEIGIWDAVVFFIRNAFVEALKPGLDASVAPRQAEKAEKAPPRSGRGDAAPKQRREAR